MFGQMPRSVIEVGAFKPLLDLLHSVLLKPEDVAKHWRYENAHLGYLRKRGVGPAFVKLPGGAIRYRAEDILASELQGAYGPLNLEHVRLAVSSCMTVSIEAREAMLEHVQNALDGPQPPLEPRTGPPMSWIEQDRRGRGRSRSQRRPA